MRPQAKLNTNCLLYSTLEEMLIPQLPFGSRPPLDLVKGELVMVDESRKFKHIKIFKITVRNLEGYVFANVLDILGPKIIHANGAKVFQKNDSNQLIETAEVLPKETPLWLKGGPSEEFCHVQFWKEDQLVAGFIKTPLIGLDK
jgi:hypothetical protein